MMNTHSLSTGQSMHRLFYVATNPPKTMLEQKHILEISTQKEKMNHRYSYLIAKISEHWDRKRPCANPFKFKM